MHRATEHIDPSFEEAWLHLKKSEEYFKLAGAKDGLDRDIRIRDAFDALFDASRVATIAYLAIENTRWGRYEKQLPSPFKEEFSEITETLHVKYFYHGNYPKEAKGEFKSWMKKVESYVKKLEKEAEK